MSVELVYKSAGAAELENGKATETSTCAVSIDSSAIDDDVDHHFPDIAVDPDQDYKATEIKLSSCAAPHMRQFHFTWVAFFMAFLAWFSIAPLLPVIKKDLNLSANDIFDSNIISVAATVLARFTVGPLCDAYGPRRVASGLLLLGAIPTALIGTIQTKSDLLAVRFFVGIIGGVFVCTQHWTANMFAKNIIGTATATVGGWGNLGGGVAQIFMVVVWNLLRKDTDDENAWRAAFIIPACLVVTMAFALLFYTQDTPLGDQMPAYLDKATIVEGRERARSRATSNSSVESDGSIGDAGSVKRTRALSFTGRERRTSFTRGAEVQMSVWSNSGAWVLFIHYAMCFGVELTVNNVAATYFNAKFNLSITSAGMIASLFGLMNLFARSLGGILSDYMSKRRGMQGRLWVQAGTLVMEGIFIVIFSLTDSLGSSIATLILFSTAVQMAEGSTYSLVPSVQPKKKGAVSGIVGAGGNVGAVCWGLFFRFVSNDFDMNFLYIGIIVMVSSFLTPFLKLEGYGDNEFFVRTDVQDGAVPDS